MSLGTAVEAACRAHVGVLQPALVVPDDVEITTYEEVREVFGSNAEIAEAAGYGSPGQHPQGSAAWTRRRTFMRNLQRYEQGRTGGPGQRRTPSRMLPRLVTVARINKSRLNTPRTLSDVIRLMGQKGTTSKIFEATVKVSDDTRDRKVHAAVYVHKENYVRVGWPMRGRVPRTPEEWSDLGFAYGDAFLIAYGIPEGAVKEGMEPIFNFTIGREDGVIYDYV